MLSTLISQATSPLTLSELKTNLKITTSSEDNFLTSLIEAATSSLEVKSARSLREKTYECVFTYLDPIQEIKLHEISEIVKIEYLLNNVPTLIDPSVYTLVAHTFKSFVSVNTGEDWPEDADEVYHNFKITLKTDRTVDLDVAKIAITRWCAYAYRNRGDCGKDTCLLSGSGSIIPPLALI